MINGSAGVVGPHAPFLPSAGIKRAGGLLGDKITLVLLPHVAIQQIEMRHVGLLGLGRG